MRIEDIHELENALGRQPSWDPPPGFALRVAMLASSDSQRWPVAESRNGWFLRAAVTGLAATALAYVVGSVALSVVSAIIQDAAMTMHSYASFVESSTRVLTTRAVQVAWMSVGLSLSFSASLMLRARG